MTGVHDKIPRIALQQGIVTPCPQKPAFAKVLKVIKNGLEIKILSRLQKQRGDGENRTRVQSVYPVDTTCVVTLRNSHELCPNDRNFPYYRR